MVADRLMDVGDDQAPALDIEVAVAQLAEAARLAMRSSIVTLSAADKRRVMTELVRQRAAVEAAYLHVLSQFDQSDLVVPGVPHRVGFAFLTQALNFSAGQAGADVAAARALDPTGAGIEPNPEPADGDGCPAPLGVGEGMPRLAAALATGSVTRAHVDVAVRCLGRVPQHLVNRVDEDGVSGRQKIDEFLTAQSLQHSPTTTDRLARQLLATLDPDGSERFDPLAYQRRHLSLINDGTGMTMLRGLLDPESAALVRAALQHFKTLTAQRPDPSDGDEPQQSLPIRDERTPGQRNVDALTALCRAALRARYPGPGEGSAGHRPAAALVKVVIVATPEQAAAARAATPPPLDGDGAPIAPPGPPVPQPGGRPPDATGPPGLAHEAESGEPITARTLSRLICDAELQTVVLDKRRAVLSMGRATRLATAAQRTALVARDRGCIAPGCPMPPSACEAHHVTWWRDGGTTDIDKHRSR